MLETARSGLAIVFVSISKLSFKLREIFCSAKIGSSEIGAERKVILPLPFVRMASEAHILAQVKVAVSVTFISMLYFRIL